MKRGMIFFVTLSLLAMAAMAGASSTKITVQPGPVEEKQGNDVTLWCKVEQHAISVIPVHWQSPPNFRTRTTNCVSLFSQKYDIFCEEIPYVWYNMTIKDAQWTDTGKYRCIHTRFMGIVDLKVLVPVGEVSLTYNVSNSTSKPPPLVLSKGVDAALTCTTSCAYPAPNISWFENGQPFKGSATVNTTESGCSGEKQGQKRTISTITARCKCLEKEKTESIISCEAGNVSGEKNISKAIVVTYDASSNITVQPGPVKVKQGNSVTLWCQIKKQDTRKVPPVNWQSPPDFSTRTTNCVSFAKNKYGISCGERPWWYNLTIRDVQWADKGRYRCIFSRHMGIVVLKVLVPVTEVSLTTVFNMTSAPLDLSKDDAVLTCKTNCGYPAPSISWFENDQLFNGRASVNKTESGCTGEKEGQKRTTSTITVPGKKRKESKIFCVAENIIGDPTVSQVMEIDYDGALTTSQPPVVTPREIYATIPILGVSVAGLIISIVVILLYYKIWKTQGGQETPISDGPPDLLQDEIDERDDTNSTESSQLTPRSTQGTV